MDDKEIRALVPVSHSRYDDEPSSTKKGKMMVPWLDLPDDVHSMIARKLSQATDYIRFGCVCPLWRAVSLENSHHLPPQIPHLMFATGLSSQTRSLYNLAENRVYNSKLPVPHNCFCAGSTLGWLVTVVSGAKTCKINLLNPFRSSKNKISLPPLPHDRQRDSYLTKAVLSADPISNPDYVVMAILNNNLWFYKSGNKSWTRIKGEYIKDVIYCNDYNEFYALNDEGNILFVNADDLNHCGIAAPEEEGKPMDGKRYLVETSSGNLLQIARNREFNPRSGKCMTCSFTVKQLDIVENKWIEINRLEEGCALFLGDGSSFSLSVSGFPGCRANCIYYTDYFHGAGNDYFKAEDMAVFNLEDGSIKPHYRIKSGVAVPAPVWIQPTVLYSSSQ